MENPIRSINQRSRQSRLAGFYFTLLGLLMTSAGASAAGILTPIGSADQPVEILDHHVDVRITDGFARTIIEQTFSNSNPHAVEAIYAFPVPESSSLSEITVHSGETVLEGEVVPRADAERIYESEKSRGNDVGMGSKESYQRYEFRIFPVRPGVETRIEVVYYQPLKIDLGIGRYVYPIAEGGTDEAAESFWTRTEAVKRSFSAEVTVRSGYPLQDVRIAGFPGTAIKEDAHTYRWSFNAPEGTLNQDLVVYYRLAENLPGRADMLTYKASASEPGYFMMTLTPGIDLEPLQAGADYLFVLDLSGSMHGKISTLIAGMEKTLGQLSPEDRVNIVTFSDQARRLTRGWKALTPENVRQLTEQVSRLTVGGSTNLYDGLRLGLEQLDADRASNVILITDGVTNTGILDPATFHQLMKEHDLRFFGFLMGNSANWPLMRALCDASDGFYTAVSTADDIIGKILMAREKIAYEALLDVDVKISDVRVHELTRDFSGKVFRGQQLTLFGRYQKGGEARLTMDARKTSGVQRYATTVDFPEQATDYPELERLWAMSQIEQAKLHRSIGKLDPREAQSSIRDLGVAYQLVTDETSMILLAADRFEHHGIERRNQQRIANERAAQAQRRAARNDGSPVNSSRADKTPMFNENAPRIGSGGSGGGGGGAFGLETLALLALAGAGLWARRRSN